MRLTIKLVAWFFVCVVIAVGLSGYYAARGEIARYESDLGERHVVMGLVLRAAFSEVMDTDGEARAVSMLDYTDKRMRLVDIRWVHLDANAPPEREPQVPRTELAPILADRVVHTKGGGKLRSYIPVHIDGRAVSALELAAVLDTSEVVRRAFARELRAVAAVALAIGITAGVLGLLLVARPMRRLIEHARRIGRGDFSPMIGATHGRDEIAQLGKEMNAMCAQLTDAQTAKLKTLEQLRHAERLSTVGTLASGLAHELGTPLNVITLRAKSIAQGRASGERAREAAASIEGQALRMTNLVRQLLDFARRRAPQRGRVAISTVVERAKDLVTPVATKVGLRLVVVDDDTPESLIVPGDSGQLEQVVTNLLMNAIQATKPDGRPIEIRTACVEATPPADHGGVRASYVRISVLDGGSGIPKDVLPHIFEPFFTTKPVGEGTGLGLAVCYGIVRDHDGWIDVRTDETGSELIVYLPLRRTE